MLKKALKILGVVIVLALLGGGAFVLHHVSAFDESMTKKYDVPFTAVTVSTDEAVLARGKHLAESMGSCISCHGANFGGGRSEEMGPLGSITYPNVTTGKDGRGVGYTNDELGRLLRHGIKRDGTSVVFMTSNDLTWWPQADIDAVVSYLRTVPPIDGQPFAMKFTPMAKVFDRLDLIPIDVARRIDHTKHDTAPEPVANAQYGEFIVRSCRGCHGEHLAGGPIPGAPPNMPKPLNLTPHETGLKGWTFEDFEKVIRTGIRKNGQKLDPFMPVDSFKNMNDTELRATWAFLQTAPPRPFGDR